MLGQTGLRDQWLHRHWPLPMIELGDPAVFPRCGEFRPRLPKPDGCFPAPYLKALIYRPADLAPVERGRSVLPRSLLRFCTTHRVVRRLPIFDGADRQDRPRPLPWRPPTTRAELEERGCRRGSLSAAWRAPRLRQQWRAAFL